MAKIDANVILTDFLKLGPKNLVGLDIGLHSVKVCELIKVKKNEYKLTRFSSHPMPEGSFIEDEIQKHDEIVETIKSVLAQSKIKNKNICIGMFGPNCIAKRLQLASSGLEDLEDQVLWESEQYIPFGIDDSTVDFSVIGKNSGGGTDVLIAAARNELVESFGILCEDAGLRMKVADLQHFALVNLFEITYPKAAEGRDQTIVLLDFGAQKTNLVIYRNRSVYFTKELNIGGIVLTEEIQRQMGLSYLEAEDLKINGDESGNLPQEILDIVGTMLDAFFAEIKKSLNFFMTSTSIESVDDCYITGGSCLLPGMMEGLENLIGIKVNYFNPFERIGFNKKSFNEDQLTNIATSGCIALGLALRNMSKN